MPKAMPRKAAIEAYRRARQQAFARLTELRTEVDAWLLQHETSDLRVIDLASLEALHARRERVVTELRQAEDALMASLTRDARKP